jgi:hypothetical protein
MGADLIGKCRYQNQPEELQRQGNVEPELQVFAPLL